MVSFGTSGWRGIVGRDVTFKKVRILTRAVMDEMIAREVEPRRIVIGYDTRMLSEKFARSVAELISASGFEALLPPRDLPSPALSAAIRRLGGCCGLMFTASHNPPEYNGVKLYTADGSLAGRSLTDSIEIRCAEIEAEYVDVFVPDRRQISNYDPRTDYLDGLTDLIDWDAIRSAGLEIAVDPLFGTSREYLDHIFLEEGIQVEVLNNSRDPYFGGRSPECTARNLSRLRALVRARGLNLGLATDGDGDRFGIIDRGGSLVEPTVVLALLVEHLARRRSVRGAVGRSVATSHLIDAVAEEHGLELIETPVGFRSFGSMLANHRIEIACEESSGFGWSKHLPERDGLLACLLVAEMVAQRRQSLAEMMSELESRHGRFSFDRADLPLEEVGEAFEALQKEGIDELAGRPVEHVDLQHGIFLGFANERWLLMRQAGTEPQLRIYAEGRSEEDCRVMIAAATQRLKGENDDV